MTPAPADSENKMITLFPAPPAVPEGDPGPLSYPANVQHQGDDRRFVPGLPAQALPKANAPFPAPGKKRDLAPHMD